MRRSILTLVLASALAIVPTAFGQQNTSQGRVLPPNAHIITAHIAVPQFKKKPPKAKPARVKPRVYWMIHQHGKLVTHPVLLGKHLNNIKFGRSQWPSLRELWTHESGWIPSKRNPSSGACGIPQALPCSKIPKFGSIKSQIKWGLNYIKGRYGSPAAALAHWYANNWY